MMVVVVSSCSPSSSATAPTSSVPPPEAPGATGAATLPSLGPAPTGVPGLAAADPFCATWAAFAGTVQALGVAASFGGLTTDRLAALELAAAPRLSEAISAIGASWPAELAAERAVVIDQRIGPYARRASRAVDALAAAGVTDDQLVMLRSAWQSSLAQQNPDAPVIEPPGVPIELQTTIDSVAGTYDKQVTPFAEDPSLSVGNVSAPATDQYLSAHCPDLASIGVGDAL
jgi:hypothetical protein